MLLRSEWRAHASGALSIAHGPQPNFDASVVISMGGLSMMTFLHTGGRLGTYEERSLIRFWGMCHGILSHCNCISTVTYGLALWGCCGNQELFNSKEKLNSTAAKIIFNLRSDTSHTQTLKIANWHRLSYKYKIAY